MIELDGEGHNPSYDTGGHAKLGGRKAVVWTKSWDPIFNEENAQSPQWIVPPPCEDCPAFAAFDQTPEQVAGTASHEIGHLIGLTHPWEKSETFWLNIDGPRYPQAKDIYDLQIQALGDIGSGLIDSEAIQAVRYNLMNSQADEQHKILRSIKGTNLTLGQIKASVRFIQERDDFK